MTDGEERERVRTLVAECLERREREGDAAVEAVCAAHPGDAAAIRARLAVLAELGFLGGGDAPPPTFPERLGDFRLLRCLGGGGMGVVYLARQESLGREVALKLVRPEQLYFPDARERFQREAHAIARLQHPAIVPIYAFGEEHGVPYFAMERVDGLGLDAVLERLAGRPPQELDGAALGALFGLDAPEARRTFGASWVEACFRLAEQVAGALEHAHQRGVVHRDVKPSNVMVTRDGRAHLFDFGLSSAHDASRLTKSGALLGSLPYLPPERVRGAAEPRAAGDVWSLGVSLYELLALELPFRGGDAEALRGAILHAEPPPLSVRNPAVPWDAETVCLTALERDPARRYATAGAFARDLGHVLALRPIEARRAGWRLRARRWVQRHPARSVALAAALLGVLVLPSALLLQQHAANRRIRTALEAESSAKREAERQRDQAHANYVRALDAIDVFLKRAGAEKLANVPQMEKLRRDLLQEALRFYRQLLEEGHDDVFLRRETARAGTKLVQVELEEAARAELAGRIAMLDAAIAAAPDEVDLRFALALAWSDLARVQSRQEKLADAVASYGEAIERFTKVVATRADDGESERQLAHSVGTRGESLTRLGRTAEAIEDGLRAVALLENLVARAPEDVSSRFELGRVLEYLGTAYEAEDRQGEALAAEQRAERELAACVEAARGDQDFLQYYAIALHDVGTHHLRARAFADAERKFREAVRIRQKLADDYPAILAYRWDLGESHMDLGETLRALGRRDEAGASFAQALALQQALVRESPGRVGFRSELAATLSQQADLLREDGKLEEAGALVRQAIRAQEECLAATPGDPDCNHFMVRHRIVLGRVLAESRDFDGAVAAFRAALPCCGKRGADRRELAAACSDAAALLEGAAELDEADLEKRRNELAAVASEALAPLSTSAAPPPSPGPERH
jgi:tetratricopeptide (TPR) repeat protein